MQTMELCDIFSCKVGQPSLLIDLGAQLNRQEYEALERQNGQARASRSK